MLVPSVALNAVGLDSYGRDKAREVTSAGRAPGKPVTSDDFNAEISRCTYYFVCGNPKIITESAVEITASVVATD